VRKSRHVLDDNSVYRAAQGARHLRAATEAHYEIGAAIPEAEGAREIASQRCNFHGLVQH
jgi:hypothetical protein